MRDKGTINIEWAIPESTRNDKVCIIFPGLSGHSRKNYVSSLVRYMSEEAGYIVGVFHNRGVAQELTSPVLPDITSSEEILEVISFS